MTEPYFITVDQISDSYGVVTHFGFSSQHEFNNHFGKKGQFPGFKLVLEPLKSNPDGYFITINSLIPAVQFTVLKHFGFGGIGSFNQHCGQNNIFPGFLLELPKDTNIISTPTPLSQPTQLIKLAAPKKKWDFDNLLDDYPKGIIIGYGNGHMWIPPDGKTPEDVFGSAEGLFYHANTGFYVMRTSLYKTLIGSKDFKFLHNVKLELDGTDIDIQEFQEDDYSFWGYLLERFVDNCDNDETIKKTFPKMKGCSHFSQE